jgi:hypothetical protein
MAVKHALALAKRGRKEPWDCTLPKVLLAVAEPLYINSFRGFAR